MGELDRINGLFVGLLTSDERQLLQQEIEKGNATIVYLGAGGFLGLGKVCVLEKPRNVEGRHD